MIDSFGIPLLPGSSYEILDANSFVSSGGHWSTWKKPINKSMAYVLIQAPGGGGGTGTVGAASTAGGGGGGSGGGLSMYLIPLALLPDKLFVSVGAGIRGGAGLNSYLAIAPSIASQFIVGLANGGNVGSNAVGGTGGSGGTSPSAANAASYFGSIWVQQAFAGLAGSVGGNTTAGSNVNLSSSGARGLGGAGGAGLPAAATPGNAGGTMGSVTDPLTQFPPVLGGTGGSSATTPPGKGQDGLRLSNLGFYCYGGTGGGSTHGSATGAGLVQAAGGDGYLGSGGGGNGGALTGSSTATQSKGGDGVIIIVCW